MIQEAIRTISRGLDLSEEQAEAAVNDIISGNASDALIAAFLTGLCVKGEKPDEISGGVKALRKHAISIEPNVAFCTDIVGTGGDQSGTFNISSAAALVAAAAGVNIAKHGNRSVSSRSGSADVFEQLGFSIDADPTFASQMIEKYHFSFLFAPMYHPAMKYAAPVRKALGIRTLFNLLGPLANPAHAKHMLVGVYVDHLRPYMAQALMNNGVTNALVVSSQDHTDEISLAAPTCVSELKNGEITDYIISPEDFGMKTCRPESMRGGDAAENARLIENIFKGYVCEARDVIALNAGAAIYVANAATSISAGVETALDVIISGKANRHLQLLKKANAEYGKPMKAGEAS